jgi:hypothetical protein
VRDCLYFTRSYSHDDAPYEALGSRPPINPRLRRALKWFGNGVAPGSLLLIKKFGPPRTPARRILCDQHRLMVAYSVPN